MHVVGYSSSVLFSTTYAVIKRSLSNWWWWEREGNWEENVDLNLHELYTEITAGESIKVTLFCNVVNLELYKMGNEILLCRLSKDGKRG
jgi:hypothetical protein